MWAIYRDWHEEYKTSGDAGSTAELQQVLGWGMAFLSDFNERLEDDLLNDLVFTQPIRLEQICKYVIGRARIDGAPITYESVARLIGNARRSPWATLWLLNTLGELPLPADEKPLGYIFDWTKQQLDDTHETVRAEACWVLARFGRLTTQSLVDVYRDASPLSQPALAAATGLQRDIRSNVAAAVCTDSELNRRAYEWGSEQIQES